MEERTAQRGDGSEADSVHLSSVVRPPVSWRTPAVILACGCLIALIGFGARSGLGFFLTPMSSAHGWGRDVFALALAIQMLLWGAAQPLAGAVADRYGAAPHSSIWIASASANTSRPQPCALDIGVRKNPTLNAPRTRSLRSGNRRPG